jgi:hypothetical protein
VRTPTDVQLAIGALIAFALWIFVVLPLLYYPRQKAPQNNQGVANRANSNPKPSAMNLRHLFR